MVLDSVKEEAKRYNTQVFRTLCESTYGKLDSETGEYLTGPDRIFDFDVPTWYSDALEIDPLSLSIRYDKENTKKDTYYRVDKFYSDYSLLHSNGKTVYTKVQLSHTIKKITFKIPDWMVGKLKNIYIKFFNTKDVLRVVQTKLANVVTVEFVLPINFSRVDGRIEFEFELICDALPDTSMYRDKLEYAGTAANTFFIGNDGKYGFGYLN